jgi:hypothetical protein
MPGKHHDASLRLRTTTNAVLDATGINNTILTHALAKQLSNGKRSVSPRAITNIMKERSDFKNVEHCKWLKVK